jgi:predicted nucleic acid-binding protein
VIVVDASVVLEVLLRTPQSDIIADRLTQPRERLHVPHLLDLEVAQVLRRYVARGEILEARGREALDLLAVFPLIRYAHEPLLQRIWQLRDTLTAYDAAYVALAEALGVTLLTRDERLSRASGIRARVELL